MLKVIAKRSCAKIEVLFIQVFLRNTYLWSWHDPTAQNNYFQVFQEIVLIKVCYLVSRQKLLQRHYSSQFFVAFVLNRTCLVPGGHQYLVLAFIQKGFVVPGFRKKTIIKEMRGILYHEHIFRRENVKVWIL